MRPTIIAIIVSATIIASSSAQDGNPRPRPGATRFAVVNIGLVFNSYEKAKEFKAELEKTLGPYKEKAKQLTNEINECEAKIKDGAPDKLKVRLQGTIVKNKKSLEDLSAEIQQVLGKKQEDNLVVLWKDVQLGIRTYAQQNEIDVVFGYGDPMDKELLDHFPNVNRKMQAMDLGSTVPLFVTPRAEIGEAVAKLLNTKLRERNDK